MTVRFCTLIFLACFMATPALATTFKIATLAPDGTRWMKEMKQGADEIEQRTAGRVKFRFYPGGIMGNDKAVLRKIRIGQLHGGAITGGGLSEIYPDGQVYSIPLAFRSYEEVNYVRQKMDQKLIDGVLQAGFVSFGFSEGGFAYLMSNSPITKAADLRGHKVWSPEDDGLSRAAFEATNIAPITLPLSDVLTGLQTGLIDTIGSSAMGAIALQWHTKIKHITDIPLVYLYGTMIIERKEMEKLSPQDQQVVQEVMTRVFKQLDKLNRDDNESARVALKKQGITFHKPTDADQQTWRGAVSASIDGMIKKGGFSQTIVADFYKQLQDFRAKPQ